MDHTITPPLTDEVIESLHAGDRLLITGIMYTGRDAAHKRLVELVDKGEPLPVDLRGQIIFFVGPTPPRPGDVIGSAGPTTSGRMDAYSPKLLDLGLKAMVGKGVRNEAVREALKRNKAVYLGATGGAGALLAQADHLSEGGRLRGTGPGSHPRVNRARFSRSGDQRHVWRRPLRRRPQEVRKEGGFLSVKNSRDGQRWGRPLESDGHVGLAALPHQRRDPGSVPVLAHHRHLHGPVDGSREDAE
jgi:fumarate hydratase subunit beta